MASVQLETSAEQLLKAVSQLPTDELERFLEHLLALKAQRLSPALSAEESGLLLRINAGFPEQPRYAELIGKRKAETLGEAEYAELLELTGRAEAHQAARLEALSQLAELRQTSLPYLIELLELKPAYVG